MLAVHPSAIEQQHFHIGIRDQPICVDGGPADQNHSSSYFSQHLSSSTPSSSSSQFRSNLPSSKANRPMRQPSVSHSVVIVPQPIVANPSPSTQGVKRKAADAVEDPLADAEKKRRKSEKRRRKADRKVARLAQAAQQQPSNMPSNIQFPTHPPSFNGVGPSHVFTAPLPPPLGLPNMVPWPSMPPNQQPGFPFWTALAQRHGMMPPDVQSPLDMQATAFLESLRQGGLFDGKMPIHNGFPQMNTPARNDSMTHPFSTTPPYVEVLPSRPKQVHFDQTLPMEVSATEVVEQVFMEEASRPPMLPEPEDEDRKTLTAKQDMLDHLISEHKATLQELTTAIGLTKEQTREKMKAMSQRSKYITQLTQEIKAQMANPSPHITAMPDPFLSVSSAVSLPPKSKWPETELPLIIVLDD
ncbi:hypothetical protein M422DRAFT_782091 [Sphaerobolus stellatus SS14]|uniref:Uncharacterized protein n=1 Tax=Sphaerobolus stellatus (strain SS14) TaxID=990650 RepID=A0A0C9V4W9_SPHS4|nr:hypothetical protein M422DRAFT_782091 [Sphaerobolus stellatus SS14]